MKPGQRRFQSLEDIRSYVNQTICHHEQLEPDAFPMTERLLVRSGQPCGMYFCVHGPRSVKFSAIWETDRNTILFYDSTGERFERTQLAAAPVLRPDKLPRQVAA